VPHLLEPLTAGLTGAAAAAAPNSQAAAAAAAAGGSPASAPILRAKLLEVVRIMYQHYPRPKEFIMKYRIQVGAYEYTVCGGLVQRRRCGYVAYAAGGAECL
jgi:hypothetical protein